MCGKCNRSMALVEKPEAGVKLFPPALSLRTRAQSSVGKRSQSVLRE